MTENRVLRVADVANRLGISAAAVWYKSNPKNRRFDPAFPRPFKVSNNVTGWLESEVNAYIETLVSRREKTL